MINNLATVSTGGHGHGGEGCCHRFADPHGWTCPFSSEVSAFKVITCPFSTSRQFSSLLRWIFRILRLCDHGASRCMNHEAQLLHGISCEPSCSLSPTLTFYFHFKASEMLWLLQHETVKSKRSKVFEAFKERPSPSVIPKELRQFMRNIYNNTYNTIPVYYSTYIYILHYISTCIDFRIFQMQFCGHRPIPLAFVAPTLLLKPRETNAGPACLGLSTSHTGVARCPGIGVAVDGM